MEDQADGNPEALPAEDEAAAVSDRPASARSRAPKGVGKKKRRRRVAAIALAVLVVSALVLRVVGGRISREILYPVDSAPLPEPPVATSTSEDASHYEVVGYRTEDGVDLRGAMFRAGDAPTKRVVVFFHGNGESAAGETRLGARLVEHLGVDVLIADYRGYGGASGSPTEDGLYEDGRAAVRATGRDAKDVVVSGWSLGTGVAVELAHEGIGRALVLLAPFTSIPDAAKFLLTDPRLVAEVESRLGSFAFLAKPALAVGRSPLAGFVIVDHFDSGSKIAELEMPVLIVHGDEDRVVDSSMGRELAAHAKHATFYDVHGGSHGVQYTPEAMEAFQAALSE